MRSLGRALVQYDWCPYKKRKFGHRHAQRRDNVRSREVVGVRKPRREASGETNPAHTLISDFTPPELWENKLLWFKPPSLWHFVIWQQSNMGGVRQGSGNTEWAKAERQQKCRVCDGCGLLIYVTTTGYSWFPECVGNLPGTWNNHPLVVWKGDLWWCFVWS